MKLLRPASPLWSQCLQILLVCTNLIKWVSCNASEESFHHIELGGQFLAHGQYAEALAHYHSAIESDPKNYMTYFKRATTFLALGRFKSAAQDLDSVIELKPDFLAARMQRGSIALKQGNLDEAHIDAEWVLRVDNNNEAARRIYSLIDPIKQDLEYAYYHMQDSNYMAAIDLYNKVVQEVPWNTKVRENRARCFESVGDLGNAIQDYMTISKIEKDNTAGILKLSTLQYELGEAQDSLVSIRECLKFDPDHKECFNHYKKVKKLANQLKLIQEFLTNSDYASCMSKAQQVIKDDHPNKLTAHTNAKLCHCSHKAGEHAEAIKACSKALMFFPHDINILCDRAEAHISAEDFDSALRDYHEASKIDQNSQRAQDGIHRVNRLIKQAKKKDYYKILGVARSASKREITKAYRKLAQKWHPDNFQEGDEKKAAQDKFIDIAAAKEVLSDPEKRTKFDNGEDPLDPEAQSQGGFNPFGQGFNPFGQGNYQFKFHFS